ncbi:MAG: Na+/H+ antiporter subunit G [Gemmobacter sp.]
MDWSLAAEIVVAATLVIAGIFGIVGSFGLLKLPDPMTRLHAPTKATTLGVGGVLIASMVYFAAFAGHVSFHELMITLFLFITAPITAKFIAKAHLHRHERPENLPDPGTGTGWAGFDETSDPSRKVKG